MRLDVGAATELPPTARRALATANARQAIGRPRPPRELDGRGGPRADCMWLDPALVKPRSIAGREAGGLTNAPWSTAGTVADRACSAPIRRNRNQRAMFRDETEPASDL